MISVNAYCAIKKNTMDSLSLFKQLTAKRWHWHVVLLLKMYADKPNSVKSGCDVFKKFQFWSASAVHTG